MSMKWNAKEAEMLAPLADGLDDMLDAFTVDLWTRLSLWCALAQRELERMPSEDRDHAIGIINDKLRRNAAPLSFP